MADQAPKRAKKSQLSLAELRAGVATGNNKSHTKPAELEIVTKPSAKKKELTPVQLKAAELWARGWEGPKIARKLADQICPSVDNRNAQLRAARSRIRQWSATAAFRDAVWNFVIMEADLASPAVVSGVIQKAIAGRVDAARLVLELNGRHSPFTEDKPAAINIVFSGVPRPQIEEGYVEGEAELVDDDDDSS